GLAKPGEFGGDVSHLNLHKTFCIPHGGGGPGVGPVAVRDHLAPYLPGDATHAQLVADADHSVTPPTSGPRDGAAGVLPISYADLRLMGAQALREASRPALRGANYLAAKQNDVFPALYAGETGLLGHETILDLRKTTAKSGVTAEDVAKRLI